MNKRAAIYTRSAIKNKRQIDFQIKLAKESVIENGHTLSPDAIYSDNGYSGSNLRRPEFERLKKDLEHKRFDALYVCGIDRLSRSFPSLAAIVRWLEDSDIALYEIAPKRP